MEKFANNSWPIWQLIDSAFPIGGFAHSGGLESAVQLGEVGDGAGVSDFVSLSLRQCARFAAPFALAVHASPERVVELDQVFDAALASTVPNRASRSQGQALLVTASQVMPSEGLDSARQLLRKGEITGHLPIVFGLLAHWMQLDRTTTADAMLFVQMRGVLSAAVRMNVVGPVEAQKLQVSLLPMRAGLIETACTTPVERAAPISPMLDLLQAQHEKLYSKLFAS